MAPLSPPPNRLQRPHEIAGDTATTTARPKEEGRGSNEKEKTNKEEREHCTISDMTWSERDNKAWRLSRRLVRVLVLGLEVERGRGGPPPRALRRHPHTSRGAPSVSPSPPVRRAPLGYYHAQQACASQSRIMYHLRARSTTSLLLATLIISTRARVAHAPSAARGRPPRPSPPARQRPGPPAALPGEAKQAKQSRPADGASLSSRRTP